MGAALRADALTATSGGFQLRIGLPWIRSMPVSSVLDLTASLDGRAVPDLAVRLGDRVVAADALPEEEERWWFLQDRLVLTAPRPVGPGRHRVAVDFRLLVPYLAGGPDGPLVLPFHLEDDLDPDTSTAPVAARDVA